MTDDRLNQFWVGRGWDCHPQVSLVAWVGRLLVGGQQLVEEIVATEVLDLIFQNQTPYIRGQADELVLIVDENLVGRFNGFLVVGVEGRVEDVWPGQLVIVAFAVLW